MYIRTYPIKNFHSQYAHTKWNVINLFEFNKWKASICITKQNSDRRVLIPNLLVNALTINAHTKFVAFIYTVPYELQLLARFYLFQLLLFDCFFFFYCHLIEGRLRHPSGHRPRATLLDAAGYPVTLYIHYAYMYVCMYTG